MSDESTLDHDDGRFDARLDTSTVLSVDKALVIMVTTEAEKPKVIEALKAGLNNYLIKPFTPEGLSMRIKETLERSAAA